MNQYYYIINGEQKGPFDLETLQSKNLSPSTLVWREGLSDWTKASELIELSDLMKVIPPPIPNSGRPGPPKMPVDDFESPPKKSSNRGVTALVSFVAIGGLVWAGAAYFGNRDIGGDPASSIPETYQEKVMTVEEIEKSDPTKFLTADGTYNTNFWGTKIKVHGKITNTATVATYKDAVVEVTYFTQTETPITTKQYNIYQYFPPHSVTPFELKIDAYQNATTIGWDVVSATAQ
jgi:hypothetical protein